MLGTRLAEREHLPVALRARLLEPAAVGEPALVERREADVLDQALDLLLGVRVVARDEHHEPVVAGLGVALVAQDLPVDGVERLDDARAGELRGEPFVDVVVSSSSAGIWPSRLG